MSRIEAVFYELPDGTRPAEEYLDSLDGKMRAKMLRSISMLEENDGDLREPYSKPMGIIFLNCGRRSGIIYHGSCTSFMLATRRS